MSLRDDILGFDDNTIVPYLVPEWGNKEVYIKEMSGEERSLLEMSLSDVTNKNDIVGKPYMATLVCLTVCDASGNRLFNYPDDIPALQKKNNKVLFRLFKKCDEVNDFKDDLKKS